MFNPTKIYFGKEVCNDLGKSLKEFGNKVLLIYGKNSIKDNGIYELVLSQLRSNAIEFVEYAGIKSNPMIEDVNNAILLGNSNNCDVILAVGGGSVIDTAKIVSIGMPLEIDAWDFFSGKAKPVKSVPVITVLTMAATGSEMNPIAVIQNNKTKQKLGYRNPILFPKISFLDPQNTYSVNEKYTAYGIVDLIAHALEAYFGNGEAALSDKFVISIIKEAMECGPQLIGNLKDYELRARIMYAATCALNGMTNIGRITGDWGVHSIGHIFSLLYDVPHGASLSIAYPAWLKLMSDRIPDRIRQLGKALYNDENIENTISNLQGFFESIGSPIYLDSFLAEYDEKLILETMKLNKIGGFVHKIHPDDYTKLLELCK